MIVVLAGGPSSEREVSLWTAETITNTLTRLNIPHQIIDPRSSNWTEHLIALKPKVVVLALHGTFGEDGTVQKILEENEIPFTGSSSVAAEKAFDKIATKEIAKSLGILTPDWQIAGTETRLLPAPVVIKPDREGSSYGITIAWKEQDIEPAITTAKQYGEVVMIEQYIAGTEVTCGVIVTGNGITALPLVEIRPETEFFDYKAKYDPKYCHEICPAEVNIQITERIQEQSVKIFEAIGCRQYARVDWIIRDNQPYFLEINTLPGMTANSLINKELAAAGISLDDFISQLITTASY